MTDNAPNRQPAAPETGAETIPPETLKSAFNAFKKRMKLTKLDHESRLGHGPMSSGGGASSIAAITPPNQFPREVWEELANQGKLKRAGHGMYAMK